MRDISGAVPPGSSFESRGLVYAKPAPFRNSLLRTTTRVVRQVAIGDRAPGRSRRTLQSSRAFIGSAIKRGRHSSIPLIVRQGVDTSFADHRPCARVGRSPATELIGSRVGVPQQHRPRITVILQTGIEPTHRKTTTRRVPGAIGRRTTHRRHSHRKRRS